MRALALAICRKNACVSSDHLPPTSQTRTTSLAPPQTPSQFGGAFAHSSFWPWREQLHPPSRNVPVVTRHVSLGTPMLCRLPTGPRGTMEVPQQPLQACVHPASRTKTRHPPTPSRIPTTQHPNLSTSCTVVAKDVKEQDKLRRVEPRQSHQLGSMQKGPRRICVSTRCALHGVCR